MQNKLVGKINPHCHSQYSDGSESVNKDLAEKAREEAKKLGGKNGL